VPLTKLEARLQLHLPEARPLVLFFGFIRKYKGLDLLLEALSQTPEIEAIIAGECYEDWSFYQHIIQENGLSERVHLFTVFIPADQVRVFFSAADLIVQPYRTATQSGISQIAYHFEKPMVVTNVGGLPEIVTHGVSGYVVEPQALAIANAMRDFFENKREVAMQTGVKAEKMRFSWAYLVKQLLG
jgi:glycosyltransferase involved in cell wall biosynthesis